jgi:NodT family efflux transporter outer membrane factor (OMF) lipoprotein
MKNFVYPLILLVLTGCTVGPDFERPDPPEVQTYSKIKDPSQFGEQKTNFKKVITESWWVDFSSPELNKMMVYGIEKSKTLMYARTAWEQSKDLIDIERGALWPAITLEADAGRQKYGAAFLGSDTSIIGPFSYYELGPSLTYLLDVFGLTRRAIEKQKALSDFHGYVYEAAYLLVTGSILDKALMIAVLNAQITALNEIIAEDKKNLTLIQTQLRLGAATQIDLINAKNQLNQDQEKLPILRTKLNQTKTGLNSMVGVSPAQWEPPAFQLKDFKLPKDLPMALPSELVRRRPDILAAESALHSANASLGIAAANFYPNILITGQLLQEALTPAHLFRASSTAFSILGSLSTPLFKGGILEAEKRAAQRAYESALANYQDVVVKAFVQINNILHALQEDQKADIIARRTVALAKESLDLSRKAYSIGAVGTLQVLDSQRQYAQARLAYAQIEGRRLQDTAQLYLAIGGKISPF